MNWGIKRELNWTRHLKHVQSGCCNHAACMPHPFIWIRCDPNATERVHYKLQFSSVQFSSVQLSSAQLSSVQFSSVQFSSVQFSSVQFSSVQFSSAQFSSVQFSSVQFSSVQFSWAQFSSVQLSSGQFSWAQSSAQFSSVQFITTNNKVYKLNKLTKLFRVFVCRELLKGGALPIDERRTLLKNSFKIGKLCSSATERVHSSHIKLEMRVIRHNLRRKD